MLDDRVEVLEMEIQRLRANHAYLAIGVLALSLVLSLKLVSVADKGLEAARQVQELEARLTELQKTRSVEAP